MQITLQRLPRRGRALFRITVRPSPGDGEVFDLYVVGWKGVEDALALLEKAREEFDCLAEGW